MLHNRTSKWGVLSPYPEMHLYIAYITIFYAGTATV